MFHLPVDDAQLLALSRETGGTSGHLLILHALAVGLDARTIVELGLGRTTGVLRAAAIRTGGVLHSCDWDRTRYTHLLSEQDEHWTLALEPSTAFLSALAPPFDLVVHDGAHDYARVRQDLEMILPRMRTFGIVCVHDTQQPDLFADMLGAIRDATRTLPVSVTNLPFSAGLAIIRVEKGRFPAVTPATGVLSDGRAETALFPYPTSFAGSMRTGSAIPAIWRRRAGYLRARLRRPAKAPDRTQP
jgi:hypothetical protein